jgi:hypothetical protein
LLCPTNIGEYYDYTKGYIEIPNLSTDIMRMWIIVDK